MGPTADNSITRALFKPIMIGVAGCNPPMQFLHEEDLAELFATFLSRRVPGVFNVAGEGTIRYSEMARLAGRRLVVLPARLLYSLLALTWKLRLQNESPASGLDFIRYPWVADTAKVQRELGFRFRYSSRDALVSCLAARKDRQ